MKSVVTLKHLFKLSGKDGHPLGSEASSIYFDGQHAIAASHEATVSIDCPQEIDRPLLVAIKDLKVAMIAGPNLQFRQIEGRLQINGVNVPAVPAEDVMPPATAEILNLDKATWRPVVRPFRLDGGRLSQIINAMGAGDIRFYLNGLYLDFATGAIVGVDGKRLHLVEDALPVVELPAGRMQGVILPAVMAKLLSSVGGVQDVFVMEREEKKKDTEKEEMVIKRVICVGAANAKFRIREIPSDTYPNYREPFDRNRSLPVALVLDARATADFLAVASIAATNPNYPVVTIFGAGRHVTVSHRDQVRRQLPMSYEVGEAFEVHVRGDALCDAIRAAGSFGSAVRMRYGREDGRGIYVGAQDFHAILMTHKDEAEDPEDDESASSASATDAVQAAVLA
jgi:hypothetical protein